MTHIRFGHSPDPDDAFMFYAFAKETIPMRGFKVEHVIEDIESLNQRALKKAELEVTAVSCHAYAYLSDKYAVMRSGVSMGDNYGPILVAKQAVDNGQNSILHTPYSIQKKRIAIPGKLTTAYLVLQLYQKDFEPVFMAFDEILEAVRDGKVDLGLIIHEGQITYEQFGVNKVLDLGEWWYERHQLPLPLGVDVIRRDLGAQVMWDFAKLFRESIEYSLENRKPALDYAIQYGRGLDDKLNDRFVGMYVNDYTVDLGAKGEKALNLLLQEAYEKKIIPHKVTVDIVG